MSLCVDFQEVENYPKEDDHYHQRMMTYEDCSEEDISNPAKWAKAGFVWNPILKTLRCKYCFTKIHHVNCEEFRQEEHCVTLSPIFLADPLCYWLPDCRAWGLAD